MAQKSKEEEVIPAGQEEIKPLNTSNAVVDGGTLVRPKEDVVIIGNGKYDQLPEDSEHTVHRVLADKLVKKGLATLKKD